jgi:hypothetical protein
VTYESFSVVKNGNKNVCKLIVNQDILKHVLFLFNESGTGGDIVTIKLPVRSFYTLS